MAVEADEEAVEVVEEAVDVVVVEVRLLFLLSFVLVMYIPAPTLVDVR